MINVHKFSINLIAVSPNGATVDVMGNSTCGAIEEIEAIFREFHEKLKKIHSNENGVSIFLECGKGISGISIAGQNSEGISSEPQELTSAPSSVEELKSVSRQTQKLERIQKQEKTVACIYEQTPKPRVLPLDSDLSKKCEALYAYGANE